MKSADAVVDLVYKLLVFPGAPPFLCRFTDGQVNLFIEQIRGIGNGLLAIAELIGFICPAQLRGNKQQDSQQQAFDRKFLASEPVFEVEQGVFPATEAKLKTQ